MSLPTHPTSTPAASNVLSTAEVVELQALDVEYLVRAIVINQLRSRTRPSVRSVSQVLRERCGRASSDATLRPLLRDIYGESGLLLAISLHESEPKRLVGSLRLQRARRFVRNVRSVQTSDGDKA